jgi:hypothetical protein
VPQAAVSNRSKGSFLFDHLVGAGEQHRRHGKAERLRGLEVDDQLKLGRCLHRKVGRLLASQDAIDISGSALVRFDGIKSV